MQMTSEETSKAYSALLVAMVSISFASIFIKWSESSPFVIAFYRLLFTCALIAPFMVWTKGFSQLRLLGSAEWALIILSSVALALHFGHWIVSLGLTLVSTSVILVTAHPMFVAGVSHFILGEKVKRIAGLGVVVAFSGVCVISVADYGEGQETLFGDLLAFLGGLCAGIYFLSGRRARQNLSSSRSLRSDCASPLLSNGSGSGDAPQFSVPLSCHTVSGSGPESMRATTARRSAVATENDSGRSRAPLAGSVNRWSATLPSARR